MNFAILDILLFNDIFLLLCQHAIFSIYNCFNDYKSKKYLSQMQSLLMKTWFLSLLLPTTSNKGHLYYSIVRL